jgi:hypothetical protein
LDENYVKLSIGTKFGFFKESRNGNKVEINLINGWNRNLFLALIDEENVDFKIAINNELSVRGICFSVNLDNYKSRVYVNPKGDTILETLESIKKKFHIRSQLTEDGKQLIALSAHKHSISYEKSLINCSRITFNVEVEIEKVNTYYNSRYLSRIMICGQKVDVFVKTFVGSTILITIGVDNTIEDLKILFMRRTGIPCNQIRFIFGAKPLNDMKTIRESHIRNESTLHFVSYLSGGYRSAQIKSDEEVSDEEEEEKETSDEFDIEEQEEIVESDDNEKQELIGERGVICFGDESKQQFRYYQNYERDVKYPIYSFTVEFRMTSKYTPI